MKGYRVHRHYEGTSASARRSSVDRLPRFYCEKCLAISSAGAFWCLLKNRELLTGFVGGHVDKTGQYRKFTSGSCRLVLNSVEISKSSLEQSFSHHILCQPQALLFAPLIVGSTPSGCPVGYLDDPVNIGTNLRSDGCLARIISPSGHIRQFHSLGCSAT